MYSPYGGIEFLRSFFKHRHLDQEYFSSKLSLDDTSTNRIVSQPSIKEIESLQSEIPEHLGVERLLVFIPKLQSFVFTTPDVGIPLSMPALEAGDIDSHDFLQSLLAKAHGGLPLHAERLLNKLVQRFEVTKKIYPQYQEGIWKPLGDPNNPFLYVLFSLVLSQKFVATKNFKYFNSLLKVNDILCSIRSDLSFDSASNLGALLSLLREELFVLQLLKKQGLLYASK